MEPQPILKSTSQDIFVNRELLSFFDAYNYGDIISPQDAFKFSGTSCRFKIIAPYKPVIVRINDFAGLRFYLGSTVRGEPNESIRFQFDESIPVQYTEEHFDKDVHVWLSMDSIYSVQCPNLTDTKPVPDRRKRVLALNEQISRVRHLEEIGDLAEFLLKPWQLVCKKVDGISSLPFPKPRLAEILGEELGGGDLCRIEPGDWSPVRCDEETESLR